MTVKQDASGRRSAQVELEVPGTPEEVWQAIATGPGMSSWFVPTSFEERDGKPVAMKLSFGPGMEPRSVVTAWDPPRTFTAESAACITPGSPPMATEWTVEARQGGTCIIRIVHSLFASTDEWDGELEGTIGGWAGFLDTLRLYLTHFRGQRSAIMQVSTPVGGTDADNWDTLTTALGVKGASVGQRFTSTAGASPLSGVVELFTENPYDALVRIDTPAPGIAAIGAVTYPGGQGMVAMNFYLYGDTAAETVARETPRWQAWLEGSFPAPTKAGK